MKFITLQKYFSAIVLTCIVSLSASAATQQLDKVVAIVNDSVVTQSQINAMVFDMRGALKSSGAPVPSDAELRKKALEQLIGESLQFQLAERNKLTVSEEGLDKSIDNIAKQNGLSVEQLKQALAKEGVSYKKFRTQIKHQLIIGELQRGLFGGKISVSDQEVNNYIKAHPLPANPNTQYELDDLLIPVEESASEADISEAKQKADALLAKARKGEDFAQLAAENESVEHNALGWRTVAQLPTIFVEKVPSLKKGEVIGPIKAANGLHLLKLMNKQGEANQLPFEHAKNRVYKEKLDKKAAVWIQEVRQSSYVKILN
jgi:peptidyl-prolyl cis-trans isomerase SurA